MYITTIYIKYMYICSMSKTYESESKTESIEYMLSCIQKGVPPLSWPPHPYVGCHSSKAGHSCSRYWRNMSPGTGGTCHPVLEEHVTRYWRNMSPGTGGTCHPVLEEHVTRYWRNMSPGTGGTCHPVLEEHVTRYWRNMSPGSSQRW